ncbi:unnamed protein product [Mesocestoides corti]|uniref:EH domain-containing protein n=1 Tax=Mesocestoides corti TaxID=53468 RepID=A0A158QVP9_MESCO|nr:unnamed protein product [Mesocestoides corti]
MGGSSSEWAIPSDNIKKYESMFESMERCSDKVSGEVMKKFLHDTKLPVEILRAIWDLSDLDKDGFLDRFEFILTMHLVCHCLEGRPLPQTLPLDLVPPNKRGGASEPLALMPPSSLSDHGIVSLSQASPLFVSFCLARAFQSFLFIIELQRCTTDNPKNPALLFKATHVSQGFPEGQPPPQTLEWAVPKALQAQIAPVFLSMDKDVDGLVAGADVHDFFVNSSLPQAVLARIWDLVDLQHNGLLNQYVLTLFSPRHSVFNREQFIVAVHLANEQIASRCSRALPETLPPALIPPSLRPVTLEPSEYEESNKLLAEIDKLRRERLCVEAESARLTTDANQRSTEVSKLQAAEETLLQTSQTLASQRTRAERYVADLIERRTLLQSQMSEVANKVKEQQASVEALRGQVTNQQISIRTQEEEVAQLRSAITDRKREETGLLQQIAERRTRVEAVETENRSISDRNDQESKRIASLELVREQLLQALDQYAKLLAGDTSVTEPDDEHIQKLVSW